MEEKKKNGKKSCTELFYFLSLLPYNMITKSKGALHTSRQQPKFPLKYNSSLYYFFFSVVPCLTHSKMKNSQCEEHDSL